MTMKPCPFCGATPEPYVTHLTKWISVQCMNDDCGVRPYTRYRETMDEAVALWNKRTDNFTAPRRGVPEAQKPPRQQGKPTPANS